jgi:hypothetical protein
MLCPLCKSDNVGTWIKDKGLIETAIDKINPFYNPNARNTKDLIKCKVCGWLVIHYFECRDCGAEWCGHCIRSLTTGFNFNK